MITLLGTLLFSQVAAGSPPPRKVVQVEAGLNGPCVLFDDGAVACWGDNGESLGLGYEAGTSSRYAPDVDLDAGVTTLSRALHTCVVLEDGKVRCWGTNGFGQLGIQRTFDVGDDERPSAVPALDLGEPARQLALGTYHSCALLQSGEVRCWGRSRALAPLFDVGEDYGNSYGESPARALVPLGERATLLEASSTMQGDSSGVGWWEMTCAALESGDVRCWGEQRVDHTRRAPVGQEVVDLALGYLGACAVGTRGVARCWQPERPSEQTVLRFDQRIVQMDSAYD